MSTEPHSDRWMIWVSLPHATFALFVGEALTVHDAAPIARYTIGWDAGRAKRYFRGRGARVEVVELGERQPTAREHPNTR